MEREFCSILHQKLKGRIKGKIFCKVVNDELKVRIDMDDLWFETIYDDFAKSVIFGLTSDYVAYEVEKKYRKFLMNRMERYYFKEEEEVL